MASPTLDEYQRFPNEIISLIIQECAGDRKTLHSLCRANKFSHIEAQAILYEAITSDREADHKVFLRTLKTNPHLSKHVRTYDSSGLTSMDPMIWTSLLTMLPRMENLKHLSLHMVDYTPPDFRMLDVSNPYHPLQRMTFRLRSLGLRRSHLRTPHFLSEERWWFALARRQAPTLINLDLLDIDEVSQEHIVQDLSYPNVEIIVGHWKLFHSLTSQNKGGLRVVDITSNIRANMHLAPDVRSQLSALEGFSSRWVGRSKDTATCLLDCLECLSNIKYLGLAQGLTLAPHVGVI